MASCRLPRRPGQILGLVGQQDLVDDMNHTIAGADIGHHHRGVVDLYRVVRTDADFRSLQGPRRLHFDDIGTRMSIGSGFKAELEKR